MPALRWDRLPTCLVSGCCRNRSRRTPQCSTSGGIATVQAKGHTVMNPTTSAILQSILSSDRDLTGPETEALRRITSGAPAATDDPEPCLLLTQKQAAQQLSVSRMTLWRLTKQGLLRPIRITPSTWRYRYTEIAEFARAGCDRRKPAATSGALRPNESEIFSETRRRSGCAEASSILPSDWKPP